MSALPLLVRQIGLILHKDLLQEWRTRARLAATGFFGLTTLVLFSFAGSGDTRVLQQNAAGYLWLALSLSSTLSLGESFRVENQNRAMEGLRLLPVSPIALYYGKALGNFFVLFLLGALLVPLMIVLYDVRLPMGLGTMLGIVALGAGALSGPGTLHAALAARARARDVLLPILLFPLVVPALLSATRATVLVLTGDPMSQLGSWAGLLCFFNLIYWSLGGVLFPRLMED